jgi:hypothetical protein
MGARGTTVAAIDRVLCGHLDGPQVAMYHHSDIKVPAGASAFIYQLSIGCVNTPFSLDHLEPADRLPFVEDLIRDGASLSLP